MQTEEWFTINKNRLGWSEFYLQSPFRFSYFRLATIMVAFDLIATVSIVVKYRNRLDFFVAISLFLAAASLFFLLMLALRTHAAMHLRFTTGTIDKLELGSNLDAVLSLAAIVTNLGLFFASLLAAGYWAALNYILWTRM
jgi:hypothetical protein